MKTHALGTDGEGQTPSTSTQPIVAISMRSARVFCTPFELWESDCGVEM